jgi:hypothetical protein
MMMKKILTGITALAFCALILGGCSNMLLEKPPAAPGRFRR